MKKSLKTATAVVLMMLVSKALGMVREILLAKQFGTSYIVDAYAIAISVPSILFSVYASGFANSYIPMYARVEKKYQDIFFSNTITILFTFSAVMAVISFIFSDIITHIVAPGFSGQSYIITNSFIQIIVIMLPPLTIFNIFSAQAQVHEDFIFANFCDFIIVNVLVIISILCATNDKPQILVWGYVASFIVATILLMIYVLIKNEASYRWSFKLKDKEFVVLAKLAIPIGLSLLANQINSVVDKMFSSSLGEGVTSALSYANKIQLIPYSLAVSVVLMVCYPKMSKAFANNNVKEGFFFIEKATMLALLIGIPVTVYFCIFPKQIVKLLFERGAFDSRSTTITANCLLCYAFGISFYSVREVLSKALAANLQQNIILRNTLISVVCNIILNFFLVRLWGYISLPISTSISGFVALLLMCRDIKRIGDEGKYIFKQMASDVLRIAVCASASALSCKLIASVLDRTLSDNLSFIIGVIISVLVFIFSCISLKVKIFLWANTLLPEIIRLRITR